MLLFFDQKSIVEEGPNRQFFTGNLVLKLSFKVTVLNVLHSVCYYDAVMHYYKVSVQRIMKTLVLSLKLQRQILHIIQ